MSTYAWATGVSRGIKRVCKARFAIALAAVLRTPGLASKKDTVSSQAAFYLLYRIEVIDFAVTYCIDILYVTFYISSPATKKLQTVMLD